MDLIVKFLLVSSTGYKKSLVIYKAWRSDQRIENVIKESLWFVIFKPVDCNRGEGINTGH